MSFRSEREKAGKTVRDVMLVLGVSDACVYQWETGVSTPRASNLEKLAALYGCSIEALLKNNPKPKSVQ